MTDEEKKQKIFAMQCPSTQKALLAQESRDPLDDKLVSQRAFKDWKAVPEAKTDDEAVGARALSYQEVKVEKKLRYNRGEYLAQMRKEEDASSVVPEKRERAIDSFMGIFSPDVIRMKFKELTANLKYVDRVKIKMKETYDRWRDEK